MTAKSALMLVNEPEKHRQDQSLPATPAISDIPVFSVKLICAMKSQVQRRKIEQGDSPTNQPTNHVVGGFESRPVLAPAQEPDDDHGDGDIYVEAITFNICALTKACAAYLSRLHRHWPML